jgi:putative ABC transport system permease protein
VLGEGLRLALLGLALGLAASLAGARLLSNLLFGVGPTDAFTLAAASVLLIAIAVLASALPTRRALRVQPALALRQE